MFLVFFYCQLQALVYYYPCSSSLACRLYSTYAALRCGSLLHSSVNRLTVALIFRTVWKPFNFLASLAWQMSILCSKKSMIINRSCYLAFKKRNLSERLPVVRRTCINCILKRKLTKLFEMVFCMFMQDFILTH